MYSEYMQPKNEILSSRWEIGILIFDANALLDVYRYSRNTREEFLNILENLKSRIWIPRQVAFEFLKNRPGVVYKLEGNLSSAKNIIDNMKTLFADEASKSLNITNHPYIDIKELQKEVYLSLDTIVEKLEKRKEEHDIDLSDDELINRISNLFDAKIGEEYSQEKLDEIIGDGKIRFEKKVPPGYMDSIGKNKKEGIDVYGDLIIWKQIIDKAKIEQKPIFLITNDEKEDWWWKASGRTIGPRPELVKELFDEAKTHFYMYNSERFLEFAKEFLGIDVKQDVIDEVRDLSIQVEDNIDVFDELKKLEIEEDNFKLLNDFLNDRPQILKDIRQRNPNVYGLVNSVSYFNVQGGALIIGFKSDILKHQMDKNLHFVEESIFRVMGLHMRVKAIKLE